MSSTKWQQTIQTVFASLQRGKKQLGFLSKEIGNHSADGFIWWIKNHKQNFELEQAVENLRLRAEQPDFVFQEVFDTFSPFALRDDDLVHTEWYAQAHTKILDLSKQLDKGELLRPGVFRGVITELKFLVEADNFHKYWGLVPLQQKVIKMYQQLLSQIDELKKTSLQQQLLSSKKLIVEEKKLDLEKVRTQKEAIQLQKEKAEILKETIVEKKLNYQAKHKEHLEAQNLLQMQQKQQQDTADNLRQENLESSYAEIANKWGQQVASDDKE